MKLDVSRLAAAMNDAQILASEIRLGHDLMPVAERVAAAYEASYRKQQLCARYFLSDGKWCATHSGRFATRSSVRCSEAAP